MLAMWHSLSEAIEVLILNVAKKKPNQNKNPPDPSRKQYVLLSKTDYFIKVPFNNLYIPDLLRVMCSGTTNG